MPIFARPLFLIASLLATCALPGHVLAQQPLNRCSGPGGNTIYTDRPCEAIGASTRLPRSAIAGAYGLRRGGCARNLQDLVYEITAAIDSHDVNRLGAVYHWVGQNAESGDRILDRLQAIVDRPLVDIMPLRAAVTELPPIVDDMSAAPTPTLRTPAGTNASGDPNADQAEAPAPPPTVRRAPIGLRLQQTLGKGITPSQTTLGLRRHLDCWWITL